MTLRSMCDAPLQVNRGVMVWIDGIYKGEGGCYGSIGGGRWVGGARGTYGYSTSARLIEPTSAWPSRLSALKLYGPFFMSVFDWLVPLCMLQALALDHSPARSARVMRVNLR